MEVEKVEELYDELMNLILRFADSGVIHGDFNEFNIMLTEDESPIIIDFPQMVSTEHENAEVCFNRDVQCIRDFFKKRFNYESELYPKFSDIKRTDDIDAELSVSGFTKQMAKDINLELDYQNNDESENEEIFYDTEESTPIEDVNLKISELNMSHCKSNDGSDMSSDFEEASHFDAVETRSMMSTATTIHPDEIKSRIKKQMYNKQKKIQRKKCVAKGEASATARNRRDHSDTIKQSHGIWGWE